MRGVSFLCIWIYALLDLITASCHGLSAYASDKSLLCYVSCKTSLQHFAKGYLDFVSIFTVFVLFGVLKALMS